MRHARSRLLFAAFCLGIGSAVPAHAAAPEAVDIELVLATDVSGSISPAEAALQREGVAAAFKSPEIVRAIQSGSLGKIGVAYIDWTSPELNRVVVDWHVIRNKATADAFAEELLAAPPTPSSRTSISSGLQLAALILENNSLQGTKRVIDVSGDGPNNLGAALAPVRDEVVAKGIIINGLPILMDEEQYRGRGFFPDIDKYYLSCVAGGKGAFVVVARGIKDFAAAIRHKLILEISGTFPQEKARVMQAAARTLPRLAADAAPAAPQVLRVPAQPEQECDRYAGFGGYGFGGYR